MWYHWSKSMRKSGGWQGTPSTGQCGGSVPVIQWLSPLTTSSSLEMRWHNYVKRNCCVPFVIVVFLWQCLVDLMTDTIRVCFQVLVAPVVEKGAVQRDIYLPDGGFQWQDSQNAKVFDGGTFLQDYPVPLEDVAVFLRRNWATTAHQVIWPILFVFLIKFLKKVHVLFSTCTFPLKTIDSASRPFFF